MTLKLYIKHRNIRKKTKKLKKNTNYTVELSVEIGAKRRFSRRLHCSVWLTGARDNISHLKTKAD